MLILKGWPLGCHWDILSECVEICLQTLEFHWMLHIRKGFIAVRFISEDLFYQIFRPDKASLASSQDVTLINHLRWMGNLVIVTHVFVIWLDIWHLYLHAQTLYWTGACMERLTIWYSFLVTDLRFFVGLLKFIQGWDMCPIEWINHPSNGELYPRPMVRRRSFRTPDVFSALAKCADFGRRESSKYQQISSWSSEFVAIWTCFLAYACKDSQLSNKHVL